MAFMPYSVRKRLELEKGILTYDIPPECKTRIDSELTDMILVWDKHFYILDFGRQDSWFNYIVYTRLPKDLGLSLQPHSLQIQETTQGVLRVLSTILKCEDKWLDLLEYFICILQETVEDMLNNSNSYGNEIIDGGITVSQSGVEELTIRINSIFSNYALGFELAYVTDRYIIRDTINKVIDNYAVAPLLSLLPGTVFDSPISGLSANKYFGDALDDFTKADYSSCLSNCRKTFESALKIICKERVDSGNTKYAVKDTVPEKIYADANIAKLLEAVKTGGLLDSYFNSTLDTLKNLITAINDLMKSVPTPANKTACHATPLKPDRALASYTIGTVASTMLLIATKYLELKEKEGMKTPQV